jgi:hypothetical protein
VLAGDSVEEESAAAQRLLIDEGRLVVAVVVPTMTGVPGQLLVFAEIEVQVPFVEDAGDVVQVVSVPCELDIMFDHGSLVLVGVLETLVVLHSFLVDLVLGESHLILQHNEERKLKMLLSLVDDEGGLFLLDVVLILGFIVEGDLQGGSLGVQQVLLLHLLCEEDVLVFEDLHPQTELVGQRAEDLLHGRRLEGVPALEEELHSALEAVDQKSVDESMHFDVLEHFDLGVEVPLVDDLEEVAEHLGPELVGRVGLVDTDCDIVFEFFYQFDQRLIRYLLLDDREVKGPNDSFDLAGAALDEDVLPRQSRSLQAGLHDVLGASDVAHGDLVLLDLGDVVRKGVAHDDELLLVEDVFVLREDVADIHVPILVAGFLDFGHAVGD